MFASEIWSRRPLLTPVADSAADFTDLLDPAAVDELLSRRGLRTPFIRMARQGKVIQAREYTRSGGQGAGITDQVADDQVLRLMAEGATLVLQGLHRLWPPLVDFGGRLSAELGHPVQINAYLTPPLNQGFAPHYDTHDVFVLQVSGPKRWVIHPPVLADPLPGQDWEKHRAAVTERAAQEPLLDVVLQPGDALYLPRGFVHSAMAQGETALHLTVGVHPVTRYRLLQQLLAEAADEPGLRASLPVNGCAIGNVPEPPGESWLAGPLAETVAAFTAYADGPRLPGVASRLADELAGATRPAPIEPLAQLAALRALGPDSAFRLRPGLRVRLDRSGGTLRLRALGAPLDLAPAAEPALSLVLAGEPVRAAELPGLAEPEALELVRTLVTAAVLVPVG